MGMQRDNISLINYSHKKGRKRRFQTLFKSQLPHLDPCGPNLVKFFWTIASQICQFIERQRGVITAIKDTVSFTLHQEIKDVQGRYLILIFVKLTPLLVLLSTATPLTLISCAFSTSYYVLYTKSNKVSCCYGDFNITPDPII